MLLFSWKNQNKHTRTSVVCAMVLIKHNGLPLVPEYHKAMFQNQFLDGIILCIHVDYLGRFQ